MMPESFEYAKNGGRKYLLRNKGDGTFEDVTAKAGLEGENLGFSFGVAAGDYDNNGYVDFQERLSLRGFCSPGVPVEF